MGNLSSNLKRARQAHFLSHSPVTLGNWISLTDAYIISIPFFEIPYGDRLTKKYPEASGSGNPSKVHVQTKLKKSAVWAC